MKKEKKLYRAIARTDFKIFKGYSVKLKSTKTELEQHFIVPWELASVASKY